MQCETVKIVAPVSDENPLGYIVINKDDLAEGDVLFGETDDKPSRRKAVEKPAE